MAKQKLQIFEIAVFFYKYLDSAIKFVFVQGHLQVNQYLCNLKNRRLHESLQN